MMVQSAKLAHHRKAALYWDNSNILLTSPSGMFTLRVDPCAASIVQNHSTHDSITYPRSTEADHAPSRNKKLRILCHRSRRAPTIRCNGRSGTCCGRRLAEQSWIWRLEHEWQLESSDSARECRRHGHISYFHDNFAVSLRRRHDQYHDVQLGRERLHDRHERKFFLVRRDRHCK